jgi:hypothetical protein
MNTYVVYSHHRFDNWDTFYIGQGKNIKRAFDRGNRNKHWLNTVNKYGYFVVVRYLCLTKEEANYLEVQLIEQYGRSDKAEGKLVNQTDGGEGSLRITDSQRKAICNSNKTRVITNETKDKIRKSLKGKKLPDEVKNKMSNTRKGVKHSEEHKRRLCLANKLRFNKITLQEYNEQLSGNHLQKPLLTLLT